MTTNVLAAKPNQVNGSPQLGHAPETAGAVEALWGGERASQEDPTASVNNPL